MSPGEMMVFAAAFVAERNRIQDKVDAMLEVGGEIQTQIDELLTDKNASAAREGFGAVAALEHIRSGFVGQSPNISTFVENCVREMQGRRPL